MCLIWMGASSFHLWSLGKCAFCASQPNVWAKRQFARVEQEAGKNPGGSSDKPGRSLPERLNETTRRPFGGGGQEPSYRLITQITNWSNGVGVYRQTWTTVMSSLRGGRVRIRDTLLVVLVRGHVLNACRPLGHSG